MDGCADNCGKHIAGALEDCLGPTEYTLVESIRAMQMRFRVYVRTCHAASVTNVEKAEEATGIGHVVANKGGQRNTYITVKLRTAI